MEQTRSAESGRDVRTSIYLDYGADAQESQFSELEISERGMVLKSRWRFAMGTQLELVFSYRDLLGRLLKLEVEAIVVDCEELASDQNIHLLMFPEISSELRVAIRELHNGRQCNRALSLN